MKIVNEKEFAELTASHTVLVDFFATWCGPCKMLSPVLEQLAGQYEGKVEFVKVDVDESNHVAEQLGIMSVPTVVLYKDGKIAGHFVGYQSKANIEKFINSVLG